MEYKEKNYGKQKYINNKHLQNTPYSLYQTEKYHLLRIHKNTHHRKYSLRNGPDGDIFTNKAAIMQFVELAKENDKSEMTLEEEKMLKDYLKSAGVTYDGL